MKRPALTLNTTAMLLLTIFLGLLGGHALANRQPWALTCYDCKACGAACALGIDPQGFVAAQLANDPDLPIYATNIRLNVRKALALDPELEITRGERHLPLRQAVTQFGLAPSEEVVTYRMKARHAAALCLECAACEKACVLELPLLRAIRQLKAPQPAGATHAK
ncbi:MAG: 4Fe-4S dicluster domain-containing protein [Acidobacteria bacterium]|nr:4Fe-4S dicluster domain-containing protein [Acidobacteriota bacterium]MBI3489393.1 4Fe-4S dicluster domain-containing protein [Acidobacteriota bacterium]